MPSASVCVRSTGGGSPRIRASIDGHISVCTPITRMPGLWCLAHSAMPAHRPPPPIGTTSVSICGKSSSISIAAVAAIPLTFGAGKLIDVVAKGVDAFGKIGQLGQIPSGAIRTFADTIQLTLNTFSQTVVSWDKGAMSAASQFTKKAGDVIDIMSKGVDFFVKLDALRSVPDAQIRNFVRMLATAMNALIEISTDGAVPRTIWYPSDDIDATSDEGDA